MEHFRLDILRHGETELSHTLRGSTDDALTEYGWQQMQQTITTALHEINAKSQPAWDAIFTSDLQRCRLFAQDLSKQLDTPVFQNAQFQEMHFGDWEAVSTEQIYQQSPELLSQFWQSPSTYTPPNAESMQQFQQRIDLGIQKIVKLKQKNAWQRVLLVSHGGVIKLLKCLADQKPLDDLLKMTAELGQLNAFSIYDAAHIRLWEQRK